MGRAHRALHTQALPLLRDRYHRCFLRICPGRVDRLTTDNCCTTATADDDSALHRLGHADDIGTITFSFWQRSVARAKGDCEYPRLAALQSTRPVHEQSKKAGSHRVTYVPKCSARVVDACDADFRLNRLGEGFTVPVTTYTRIDLVGKKPQVVLVFRYRPLGKGRSLFVL